MRMLDILMAHAKDTTSQNIKLRVHNLPITIEHPKGTLRKLHDDKGNEVYKRRFLAKVEKQGPILRKKLALGPCWLWFGARYLNGYGIMRIGGKQVRANRVAWLLFRGPIPAGEGVLHKCDNVGCVRPSHLFLGKQLANNRDCAAKGRKTRGTKVNTAKLNPFLVQCIRREYKPRVQGMLIGLSKKYKVSRNQIWMIVTRKNWRHVA